MDSCDCMDLPRLHSGDLIRNLVWATGRTPSTTSQLEAEGPALGLVREEAGYAWRLTIHLIRTCSVERGLVRTIVIVVYCQNYCRRYLLQSGGRSCKARCSVLYALSGG